MSANWNYAKIAGKIVRIKSGTGRTGKPWAIARVVVEELNPKTRVSSKFSINIKGFGDLAATLATAKENDYAEVEGRLKNAKYTGQDGSVRWSTDLVANSLQVIPTSPLPPPVDEMDDGDIPF